jgi:hypothetical protein
MGLVFALPRARWTTPIFVASLFWRVGVKEHAANPVDLTVHLRAGVHHGLRRHYQGQDGGHPGGGWRTGVQDPHSV